MRMTRILSIMRTTVSIDEHAGGRPADRVSVPVFSEGNGVRPGIYLASN